MVCEIGCGTARNLIKMAKRYPSAHFYGLDASDEMLKTARKALARSDVRVHLEQAFAIGVVAINRLHMPASGCETGLLIHRG